MFGWGRKKELANLEESVVQLINRMLSGLPGRAAEVSITRPGDGGIEVRVTPVKASAAPLSVFAVNGDSVVGMTVGKGSPWDVVHSKRAELLSLVREVFDAVLRGNVAEKQWYEGEKLVKARATFWFDGEPNRIFWFDGILNPFRRRTMKVYRYAPYQ